MVSVRVTVTDTFDGGGWGAHRDIGDGGLVCVRSGPSSYCRNRRLRSYRQLKRRRAEAFSEHRFEVPRAVAMVCSWP